MLVLRTAVLIVSGAQQAALDPDNAYVTEQTDGEIRMFEQATSVPIDVMTALIKADLGLAAEPGDVVVDTPLIGGIDPAAVVTLDLSSQSDVYDSAFVPGGWLLTDLEGELARRAIADGAALVVTRFGQPRLSRATPLSQDSPDVVPTGINIWPDVDARAVAPWDGEVVDGSAGSVTLRGRRIRADAFRRHPAVWRRAPGCAPVTRWPRSRRAGGPKSACDLSAHHPRRP